MRKHNTLKQLLRSLYCYHTPDPGDGGDPAGGGGGDLTEDPAPDDKGNKGKSKGKAADNAGDDETAALKKELEAAKKEAAKLKEAEAARLKEEADKNKSLEQKLAEAEAEKAVLARENLIHKTKSKLGLTDPVYDDIVIKGDTEDEIETSLKAFETKLKASIEKAGGERKPTGGAPTGGKKPEAKGGDGDPIPVHQQLFKQRYQ